MLHIPPTNLLLLNAKQESYKKAYLFNEKYWRIFWKKFRRKGQQAEKDKTERVTGLGRRTREEIAKWNQMAALRFQTGERHQTSPASLRGLHLGIWTNRRARARLVPDNDCLPSKEYFQLRLAKVEGALTNLMSMLHDAFGAAILSCS